MGVSWRMGASLAEDSENYSRGYDGGRRGFIEITWVVL